MTRTCTVGKSCPRSLSEAYYHPTHAPHAKRRVQPLRWVWGLLRALGFLIVLPFRLLAGALSLVGRLLGLTLGFTLMVVGMALWAGPLFLLGIPLFLIGLLMTLRSLS